VWQKHFTSEENYFLFVFATGNFIILFTKAAASFSSPLVAIVGKKERRRANLRKL